MSIAPVALIFFNRPLQTLKVLQQIRRVRPSRIHLISDGPRLDRPDEAGTVQSLRETVERMIDWQCNVTRHYATENMGCGRRVSTGITDVLAKEGRAIFVEDDCLPTGEFFHFCSEKLEEFESNPKVASIAGTNLFKWRFDGNEYGFSRFPMIWGWATWQRSWEGYKLELDPEGAQFLRTFRHDSNMLGFREDLWRHLYSKMIADPYHTWDYQFIFGCMRRCQLTLVPSYNLVSNIGFGPNATHTKYEFCRFAGLGREVLPARGEQADSIAIRPSDVYDLAYQNEYVFGLPSLKSIPHRVRFHLWRFYRKWFRPPAV